MTVQRLIFSQPLFKLILKHKNISAIAVGVNWEILFREVIWSSIDANLELFSLQWEYRIIESVCLFEIESDFELDFELKIELGIS